MGDFSIAKFPALPTIHPWSLEAIGTGIISIGGTMGLFSAASGVYPVANRAILIPFVLGEVITVTQLFAYKGATISGNLDVGIYTNEGGTSPVCVRIVSSGSTAQSEGANVLQLFDITDTQLAPGSYYMAIALDNTTGTLFRGTVPQSYFPEALGIRNLDGAFPLPATITSFTEPASLYIPVFGLLQGRTVI